MEHVQRRECSGKLLRQDQVEDMLPGFFTGHYRLFVGAPGGLQSIHFVNLEFCVKLV